MRFELKQRGEAISNARIRIASQRSNGTAGNDMRAVADDVCHSASFAFEARRYPEKCRRVYHFARPDSSLPCT